MYIKYINIKKYYLHFCILLLLFFAFENIISQNNYPQDYFASPMDIPLILSGNFGELRPYHFHAGIDIKTEGKTGKKIYSIADGYISRIKVSPWGYGKTLYIDHPNGYTSVYAHLMNYNDTLENFVKNAQYKAKSFSIELFPDPDDFMIKKGELIGISGNTGHSGGPHLHFEIRKTKSEHPVNTMLFNFNITDNIKPEIHNLYIYPIDSKSMVNEKNEKEKVPVYGKNGRYRVPAHKTISLSGNIGFGLELTDYQDLTNNKFGIYSIELKIDSTIVYYMELNEFSYNETRYINSYMDFEEYLKHNARIHKTYIEPNNKLSIYKETINRGIFSFITDSMYDITFTVKDVYSNTSILNFSTRRDTITSDSLNYDNTDSLLNETVATDNEISSETNTSSGQAIKTMPYQLAHYFDNKDIIIIIPKDALYDTINFTYSRTAINTGMYSDIHHIHNRYTPLHKDYTLSIKTDSLTEYLTEKALIACIGTKRIKYAGGEIKDGYITAEIREFGDYAIVVDTVPPKIKPLNIKKNANLANSGRIDIKITDDLSGINTYSGYIDNNWVLFEYEPKKNLITYTFDNMVNKNGELHDFKLIVTDLKNNRSEYITTFYY